MAAGYRVSFMGATIWESTQRATCMSLKHIRALEYNGLFTKAWVPSRESKVFCGRSILRIVRVLPLFDTFGELRWGPALKQELQRKLDFSLIVGIGDLATALCKCLHLRSVCTT